MPWPGPRSRSREPGAGCWPRAPRVPPGHVQPAAGGRHRDGAAAGRRCTRGSTSAWCWSCSTWAPPTWARPLPENDTLAGHRHHGRRGRHGLGDRRRDGTPAIWSLAILLFVRAGAGRAAGGPAAGALHRRGWRATAWRSAERGELEPRGAAEPVGHVAALRRLRRCNAACALAGLLPRRAALRSGSPWRCCAGWPGPTRRWRRWPRRSRRAGSPRPERGALCAGCGGRGGDAAAIAGSTAWVSEPARAPPALALPRSVGCCCASSCARSSCRPRWNPKGMQNLGLAYALYPALEQLYPDPQTAARGGAPPPGLLQHPPLRGGGHRGRGRSTTRSASPRGEETPGAGGGLQGGADGAAGGAGRRLLLALAQARGGRAVRGAGAAAGRVGGGAVPGPLQRGAPHAARPALSGWGCRWGTGWWRRVARASLPSRGARLRAVAAASAGGLAAWLAVAFGSQQAGRWALLAGGGLPGAGGASLPCWWRRRVPNYACCTLAALLAVCGGRLPVGCEGERHGDGQRAKASFEIINALGLHARAAAQLVKVANRYKCEVHPRVRRPDGQRQVHHGRADAGRGAGHEGEGPLQGRGRRGVPAEIGELIANRFGEAQ